MSQQQLSQEEAVRAIYTYAAQLMRQGKSNRKIEELLMKQGLSQEVASTVVANLDRERGRQRRDRAGRDMAIGGVICVIGLAVTFCTFQAASGGGRYVVAYGAIIFGAFQFLRGVYYSMN